MRDLIERDQWSLELKDKILLNKGSVQAIDEIPEDIKELYKTTWEIKQRCIIDMAADRGAYIDQSQSLNIHMTDANAAKVTTMHFYGWRKGLKTGMYYLRTKAAADAIQFTIDASVKEEEEVESESLANLAVRAEDQATVSPEDQAMADISCSLDSIDDCLSCGS